LRYPSKRALSSQQLSLLNW